MFTLIEQKVFYGNYSHEEKSLREAKAFARERRGNREYLIKR